MEEPYENEISKMRWSYSRLNSFENCKYNFYLKYIVNDNETYLAEGNYYSEAGKFVHEILEKIFKGELSSDDAAQYYVDNYDDYVCYKTKESVMNKTFESCANFFADVDFSKLKGYKILGVELFISDKIDGYDYIGYIDLLLENEKTHDIIIVDHKSSAYPLKRNGTPLAKSKENFESYKKQMYLYSHAVKEMYGKFPKLICWNHFKDGKVAVIPFDEKEYENSLKWFTDTIHMIEKENDFEQTQDFFYCANLCEFRNCCEYRMYNNEE